MQEFQPQPQPADGHHKDEEDSGACRDSRRGAWSGLFLVNFHPYPIYCNCLGDE